MSLMKQLVDLGFEPIDLAGVGDFEIRDDSDGSGPRIVRWLSDRECPFKGRLRVRTDKQGREPKPTVHPAKARLRAERKARRLPNELKKRVN